jgi:hypothetical protein
MTDVISFEEAAKKHKRGRFTGGYRFSKARYDLLQAYWHCDQCLGPGTLRRKTISPAQRQRIKDVMDVLLTDSNDGSTVLPNGELVYGPAVLSEDDERLMATVVDLYWPLYHAWMFGDDGNGNPASEETFRRLLNDLVKTPVRR